MSRLIVTCVLLGCGLAHTPVVAADQVCTPDISWSDIPEKIRSKVSKSSGGEVSPRGGPFNPTDVLERSVPQARFFGACHAGKRWVVAVERGGRGYHLELYKFYGSVMTDWWQARVPDEGFSPQVLIKSGAR
jgi:hypothetical protein